MIGVEIATLIASLGSLLATLRQSRCTHIEICDCMKIDRKVIGSSGSN